MKNLLNLTFTENLFQKKIFIKGFVCKVLFKNPKVKISIKFI